MVVRLAHVAVGVDDLGPARAFYRDVLGLVEHSAGPDTVHLRAQGEFDTWSVKLAAADGPGLVGLGLRVAEPADLDRLHDLHERLGIATEALPGELEPGRGPGLRATVPGGHTVDFHHEIAEVDLYDPDGTPRLPARRVHEHHGVAPERLDHVNLRVPDLAAALGYWVDALRFSVAETVLAADGSPRRAWLRRTRSTHDIAMGQADRPGFHHLAFALTDTAALVRAADVLADAGVRERIEFGPGRHGVTDAMAMYVKDPSGNRIELYSGDYQRDLDRPAVRWSAEAYERAGIMWWGQRPPASFAEFGPLIAAREAVAR